MQSYAWGDSSVLVAANDTLTVRDLASGRLQGEAIMAAGRIKALHAINDQNVLLMTEQGLQIWDVSTRRAVGRTLNVNPGLNSGFFRSSEMTATRLALKLNSGRTYEAWDVESGCRLFVISNPITKQFVDGAVDPSGASWFSLSNSGVLDRFDVSRLVSDREPVEIKDVPRLIGIESPNSYRYSVRVGNEGQALLQAVDSETLQPVGPPLSAPSRAWVWACSPRNDVILSGCSDGSAFLWSPLTGKMQGVFMRHPQAVSGAAFSPDGRVAATSAGRHVRLWDVHLCRPIGPPLEHVEAITRVVFSVDGRWLLALGVNEVSRWPVPTPMEGDPSSVLSRIKELTHQDRPETQIPSTVYPGLAPLR
jgi:WD40 repeat protein